MYTPYSKPVYLDDEDDDLYYDEIYQEMTMNQAKFYQLGYYQQYFNVSTLDVMHRLRKSLWPFLSKTSIFEDEDRIDLYGPIWIMVTLIVEIAIVGFINYQIDIATLAFELKSGTLHHD